MVWKLESHPPPVKILQMVLLPTTGAQCSAPLDSAVKGTSFFHLFLFLFLQPITQALDTLRTPPQEENMPGLVSTVLGPRPGSWVRPAHG